MVNKISIIILILSVLISGCEKKKIVYKKILRPVKYQTVKKMVQTTERSFSGMAMPQEQSKISFKIGGTLKKIYVKVGDKVKKGDTIAKLDSEFHNLQLQEAYAAKKNVDAQVRYAKATYKRVQALYENKHASRNDLDEARTGYEMAQAGIKTVNAKLAQARLQIKYTTLKAPADGKIAYVLQKENENIAAGYPIVVLNYGTSIEIEIGVPESLINSIKMGDKVNINFSVLPNKKYSGEVIKIGISPQLDAPTFPVTVKFDDKDKKVKSGMIANVKFLSKKNDKKKIIIPSSAFSEDDQGKYVYVVENISEGKGVVKRRDIDIGKLTDQGIEIVKGLSPGDKIVVAGITKINSGLEVKVLSEGEK